MEILGIITARKDSKRLPGKNTRLMAGKPMIQYTFDAAKKSRRLSRLVVTTDDPKVAELAYDNDVAIIIRPAPLARADTPTPPVLRHTLASLLYHEGYIPDMVVLLQPTSPLRIVNDIDGAVDLATHWRGVRDVATVGRNGQLNGAVFVYNYRLLMKMQDDPERKLLYYQMPESRSTDVDTESDFETAEKFLTK